MGEGSRSLRFANRLSQKCDRDSEFSIHYAIEDWSAASIVQHDVQ